MSLIDQEIVQMQFDNSNFEQNARESMSTLDKLKAKLHIDDDTSPIQAIGYAINELAYTGVGGLANAVDEVHLKFSGFEIMAIRVLSNIADAAYNAGTRLVKSLSVDQISAGWDKFNKKTTSVGTLIAQGYDMEEVDKQLERLNWFTDETSYNFTDMVNEIGKFTASGQKLDDSVTAMEGIALWAALSGQNAATASRAMYQLSQAMSAKVIKRQDWQSIQSANMDTAEFRQKALDAAEALNTVRKNADGTYRSLKSNSKKIKNFSAKTNFVDSLTEGLWFTDDVLMTVLKDYSGAVDDIYKAVQEGKYDTASEAIDDMGSELDAFQVKALKAGQEARTLTDVIDSVKDAVSTNWMTTWERIFGNYEEATKFWTQLANEMWDVFAAGGSDRNEMLATWVELGGRDSALASFWNTWHSLVETLDTVKGSFHEIFPAMNAYKLKDITDQIEKFTGKIGGFFERLKMYRELWDQGIFSVEDRDNRIKKVDETIKRLQDERDRLANADYTDKPVEYVNKAFEQVEKLDKRIADLKEHRKEVVEGVYLQGDLMSDTELTFFNKIYNTITSIFNIAKIAQGALGAVFSLVKTLVAAIFPSTKAILDLGSSFGEWVANLRETLEVNKTFENFVTKWSPLVEKFGKIIGKTIEFVVGLVTPLIDFLSPVFNFIGGMLQKLGGIIEWFFGLNEDKRDFNDDISRFADETGHLGEVIDEKLSPAEKIIKGVTDAFDKLKKVFVSDKEAGEGPTLWERTVEIFGKLFHNLKELFTGAQPLLNILATALGNTIDTIHELLMNLLGELDFSSGMNLAESGIFALLGSKLIEWITHPKLAHIGQILGDFGSSLADFLDNIRWAITTDLTSKSLLTMAEGIAIMAGSLLLLSAVPTDNLMGAITAMGALVGVLYGLMKGLSGITPAVELISKGGWMEKVFGKTMKANQILIMSAAVIMMAGALLMLAGGVKMLAKLNPDQVGTGVVAIVILIEMMLHATKKLSELKGNVVGGMMNLIAFANAIKILATPVIALGQLKADQALSGVGSVLVLMYALAEFAEKTKGMKFGTGMGMLVMAASILVITESIKRLGALNPEEYTKGLFAFIIVLTALWKFIDSMKSMTAKRSDNFIKVSAGLIVLGTALNIIANAVSGLGALEFLDLVEGLVAFVAILTALYIFIKNITKITPKAADKLIKASAGMVILGVAINIFAYALQTLASLGTDGLCISLIALGGGLVILTAAVQSLAGKRIASGTKNLALLSVALIPFALAMKILGSIPLLGVVGGLVAMAGAFLVLGVAATALKPLIPSIIQLSGSLLPLAGSIALIGLGLVGFALAVKALTDNVHAADAIPTILALLIGITMFAGMAAALSAVIAPMLALAGAIALLSLGLLGLAVVFKIFGVDAATSLIIEFLNGIAAKLPDIIEAGINVIVALFQGIAQGLLQHGQEIAQAVLDAIGGILYVAAQLVAETILHLIEWIKDAFLWIFEKLGEAAEFLGIINKDAGAAYGEAVAAGEAVDQEWQNTQQFAVDGMGNVYEVYSNGVNDINHSYDNLDTHTAVENDMNASVNAITNAQGPAKSAASGVAQSSIDGLLEKITGFTGVGNTSVDNYLSAFFGVDVTPTQQLPEDILYWLDTYGYNYYLKGQDAGQGYVNGILSKVNASQFAADSMGKHTIASLAKAQFSLSPSRKTRKLGTYFGDGYILGIKDREEDAADAAKGIGNTALKSMRNALSRVSDILGSDLSNAPTIRPVLDLSSVEEGATTINDLFANNPAMYMDEVVSKDARMTQQINDAMSARVGELKDIMNTHYEEDKNWTVTVPVNIDGRETARVIAPYARSELTRLDRNANRRSGKL